MNKNPHDGDRNDITTHPLVVLGGGYVGTRLFHRARAQGHTVLCTSRHPSRHLLDIPPEHRLTFDLTRPNTWNTLPDSLMIIWCFPACPIQLVRQFLASRPQQPHRLVVLGSTSAYPSNGTTITEQHEPNTQLDRVQGEEYLRTAAGAVILRLAGIYGPGRHVLDWIRKGKIRNTPRLVNLVHVDDVVDICLKALTVAPHGSTYVVSDGTARPWSDICSYAARRWHIPIPPLTQSRNPGKHIDNHKLLGELGHTFHFPDLYQALNQLEIRHPQR